MNKFTLQLIRKQHNLKQRETAELLGISQQGYADYERGATQIPHERAEKFKQVFNVTSEQMQAIHNLKKAFGGVGHE